MFELKQERKKESESFLYDISTTAAQEDGGRKAFLLADGVRVGLGSCTLEGTVVPVGIECFALDGTVTSASTPLPGDMIDSGDGECVSLSPDDGCGGTLSFSLFAKLPQTGTSRDNPSHLARAQPI